MNTLFFAISETDYDDSQVESTFFYSFDKEEAIEAAITEFNEMHVNLSDAGRPEVISLCSIIHNLNPETKGWIGGCLHSMAVVSAPISEKVTAENSETVWTASFSNATALLRKTINEMIQFDLNISVSETELDELVSMFLDNPETFREGNMYGISKHSSELLTLLSEDKKAHDLFELEK